MMVYGIHSANTMRRMHNARFGLAHDVVIRVRPDGYRHHHSRIMRPGMIDLCLDNLRNDTLYGVSKGSAYIPRIVPGGSQPLKIDKLGQVLRPWDGNSGDNFWLAQAPLFDQVVSEWFYNFDELTQETYKWNDKNPEAMLGTIARKLKIQTDVCFDKKVNTYTVQIMSTKTGSSRRNTSSGAG